MAMTVEQQSHMKLSTLQVSDMQGGRLHCRQLPVMAQDKVKGKNRASGSPAPQEGHEEAEANVDHDGDVDVVHVVLGHVRIRRQQLRVPG